MRILLTLICVFLSSTLMAKDRPLLKCLGEEEKRFHAKKETGPLYDLNQQLISEMVQIPHVSIEHESFLQVCTGSGHSESLKLLELSLKRGKELFVLPETLTGAQGGMTTGMIDDYVKSSKDILLSFISQIQSLSPTPDCLNNEIPELRGFFTEIKYLQEDVDIKTLFKNKDLKIFSQLKDYPLSFVKCRTAEAKRKALLKARALKKKKD
ncbi:MAG TPA: hypothetical protein VNJ01_06595 [Bacteriovoracaceae bacterium]|nr:hypothetical protein [Bacteriovoracaceae bacterium]